MNPYLYIVKAGLIYSGKDKFENTSGNEGVVVGDVDSNYGADFNAGDVITSIKVSVYNNTTKSYEETTTKITKWSDVLLATLGANYDGKNIDTANDNEKITITFLDRIEKDGVITYTQKTTNEYNAYSNEVLSAQGYAPVRFIFGCSASTYKAFGPCMEQAVIKFGSFFNQIIKTLKALLFPSNGIRSIGAKNLSSVVGIYDMVSQYLALGPATFLFFVALLSVNIGIMNLLPIPALDGGRIVLIIFEAIRGKKMKPEIENGINLVGFVLLMLLMIVVMYNDILKLM
jgi:regulator of sigma E protease